MNTPAPPKRRAPRIPDVGAFDDTDDYVDDYVDELVRSYGWVRPESDDLEDAQ